MRQALVPYMSLRETNLNDRPSERPGSTELSLVPTCGTVRTLVRIGQRRVQSYRGPKRVFGRSHQAGTSLKKTYIHKCLGVRLMCCLVRGCCAINQRSRRRFLRSRGIGVLQLLAQPKDQFFQSLKPIRNGTIRGVGMPTLLRRSWQLPFSFTRYIACDTIRTWILAVATKLLLPAQRAADRILATGLWRRLALDSGRDGAL